MMTSDNCNPVLFVCGVPRSGTTLLQRMLDSHPQMAVANDTHFIPRAIELTDKGWVDLATAGKDIPLEPELIEHVRNYHRTFRLGLPDSDFERASQDAPTYQQFVSRIYDRFAARHHKPLAGEKTPDYIRRVSLLHGLFPKAKFIHLIRDGRDVALSLAQWAKPDKGPGRIELWNKQPIAVCALWWNWLASAGREQTKHLDRSLIAEIHYDALTCDPESTLHDICDFLEIEYSAGMLEYNRGKERQIDQSSLSAKSAWLSPQTGLRNWKTDMSANDIGLFELLAGDALDKFGFERQCDRFAPETQDLAVECQTWWRDNFLSRHATGPKPKGRTIESCVAARAASQKASP